jgi:hypothetical protein
MKRFKIKFVYLEVLAIDIGCWSIEVKLLRDKAYQRRV